MLRTPPPKLPSRPPSAVNIYKTLPDASKADLPPKPCITPASLTSTKYHVPRVVLTPEPSPEAKRRYHGQKRKYSGYTDAILVPLQSSPTWKRTRNANFYGHNFDGVDEREVPENVKKTCRTSPNNTGAHNGTYNYHEHSNGTTMHQAAQHMSEREAALLEIRLIHNKLLGGATTLTGRDQDYLRHQMNNNPANIPALMVDLITKNVTNKTDGLSYGMMNWAHSTRQNRLLEDVLMDKLYNFDMDKAFDEGLMSLRDVGNLMDCQTVLEHVRNNRTQQPQKEETEHSNVDAETDDEDGNDSRSQSMELTDDD
ncbi:hypothetical protein F4824DRAFT_517447 [Ustulina deusta]|nr:hypothetical protein F4824DRAFT_517447 [Ustulina deusta]